MWGWGGGGGEAIFFYVLRTLILVVRCPLHVSRLVKVVYIVGSGAEREIYQHE